MNVNKMLRQTSLKHSLIDSFIGHGLLLFRSFSENTDIRTLTREGLC